MGEESGWARAQEHRRDRGVESDRRILLQNKTGNNWPKEQNHTVFPVFYSCTRQGSHPGQYGETAATSNQLPYNTDRSPFKADLVNVLADFCWLAHPADVCGQVSSSISPIFTLNMVSVTCWVNYPGSLAAKFTTIFTDLSLTFDLKLIRLLFLCCAGSVQCVYQSFFFFPGNSCLLETKSGVNISWRILWVCQCCKCAASWNNLQCH